MSRGLEGGRWIGLFLMENSFTYRALDRNEYNHITATYFLLAERKLRAVRQEQAQRRKPELTLPVSAAGRYDH